MVNLLLAVIYVAFISLGLPDAVLGAAWPTMSVDLGAPISWAGGISMTISAGTIVSALLSDRMTLRFGAGKVTAVSVALTALALFGFSVAPNYWVLILLAIPYGLGAGGVEKAAEEYGVELKVLTSPREIDIDKQIELIRQVTADKPDVMILSAADYDRCAEATEEAIAAGIGVVAIDTDVNAAGRACFVGGLIGMGIMILAGTTIIIPGIVAHFMTGGATGVIGNGQGGRRGAIIGSFVNGLAITFLPLFLLPVLGDMGLVNSTYSDADFGVAGILLGCTNQLGGQTALVAGVLIAVAVFYLASFLLTRRDKAKQAAQVEA